MHTNPKRALVWALLFTGGVTIGTLAEWPRARPRLPLSDFVRELDSGGIQRVRIEGDAIEAVSRTAGSFRTYAPGPYVVTLIDRLLQRGVTVDAEPTSPWLASPWLAIVPVLILQGLLGVAVIRTRRPLS